MSVLTDAMRDEIRACCEKYPNKQAVTLPALHLVQAEMRCVPREAVVEIADLLELRPAEVHDTLSFYGFYRDEDHKLGRKRVYVCRSISCMLRGGEELFARLCDHYKVGSGQTTDDGRFTLEFAECLGACEGAPCMLVEDECHINQSLESARTLLDTMVPPVSLEKT